MLVVDDEPTLRLGFAYALSNRTTTVDTAANGRHALERIATADFDIMILDLRMPDLDGLGVIETLRQQGNQLSIVLCSAALSPKSALHAVRLGVVDFLLKPVRPVDLRQVIQYILHPGSQSLPRALQAARRGDSQEAIRILSGEKSPSRQAACWLSVLKSIQDTHASGSISGAVRRAEELEEVLANNLSMLAFNSTPVL